MSHHHPYRRHPPPAEESRPNRRAYNSSDHRLSGNYNFYRQPQQPSSHLQSTSSSSYPSSSSSRPSVEPSHSTQRSDDALSILSSCGLEPNDLSLLAELPEDVLTLETLPDLLKEIKGKRETTKLYPPVPPTSSSSSSHPGSSRLPSPSPANKWEHIRNQPVQYPLDHAFITPKPLPPEQVQDWQDRWGNPRQTGSITYKPSSTVEPLLPSSSSSSSSLSSSYVVDDVQGREDGSTSRYERPSYSLVAAGDSRKPPHFLSQPGSANYRSGQSLENYRSKARAERRDQEASYNSSNSTVSKLDTAHKIPARKAALDFHGTTPVAYPYSCSLCDITVLSEKFWIQHINGPQHADGQLTLLQMFPDWDCRMESSRRVDDQLEKPKDDGRPAHLSQTTNQQPNKKAQKKTKGSGKVVCAKFPAQSVDEEHLRTLTQPFGKIVKVLMFPSLAFVELGSSDQAKDLVKYYSTNPTSTEGGDVTFYLSSTFNFLQSSRVVSFTPAPAGEDGFSDLIGIAKRFGPPLYTLFLPSLAFVEMKHTTDAQKLVDYYSSNTLRINNEVIKVAFSGEYNSLMRVSSAKRYEEETPGTKRERDLSPQMSREDSTQSKRRWRTREEGRSSSSRSSDGSRRSCSADSRPSEEAPAPDQTQQTHTESKVEVPAPSVSSEPEISQTPKQEPASSGEESDIEGMEVIGEDGEDLEDMEVLDDIEEDIDVSEEEPAKEDGVTERTGVPEQVKLKEEPCEDPVEQVVPAQEEEQEKEEGGGREEVPEQEEAGVAAEPSACRSEPRPETQQTQETQQTDPEEEEEFDFPEDLENCITLDELGEDDSDDEGPLEPDVEDEKDEDESESSSSRVVYFKNLPDRFYTDSDFLKITKGFGKVSRYFLIRNRREGFIEMSCSSEAVRAARELSSKSCQFKGSVFTAQLSHKYKSLTAGWKVQSDSESEDERRSREQRSQGSRRSERGSRSHSKSKTSDEEDSMKMGSEREESTKKPGGRKESARETPEESVKKSPEEEESVQKCTEEAETTMEVESKAGIKDQEKPEEGRDDLNTSTDPQKPEGEKSASGESLKDGEAKASAADMQPQPGPAGGTVEPQPQPGPAGGALEPQPQPGPAGGTVEPQPQPGPAGGAVEPQPQPGPAGGAVEPQPQPGPAGGAVEPAKPTKPVGTEFVRPVVGYFCNLCKVIYADEDEAKSDHCSSLSHYQKYQEQTGRDPWAS